MLKFPAINDTETRDVSVRILRIVYVPCDAAGLWPAILRAAAAWKITNKVFFDIEIEGSTEGGRVDAFGDSVPKTVDNFSCPLHRRKGSWHVWQAPPLQIPSSPHHYSSQGYSGYVNKVI
jgi:hypothetical protein